MRATCFLIVLILIIDLVCKQLTTDLNLTVTPADVNFAKYGEATDDTQGVVMGWGATFVRI